MKYYSVCKTSPSESAGTGRRHNYWELTYSWRGYAPPGFIFHDTKHALAPEQLRKALFILSKVANDVPVPPAFCIIRDPNTVVASFCASVIPKLKTATDWMSNNGRGGYKTVLHPVPGREVLHIIENTRDSNSRIFELDSGELYSACTQLSKLAGACPCPLEKTGECFQMNFAPVLPSHIQTRSAIPPFDPEALKVKRYKEVAGFEYVPPLYTTSRDFMRAFRNYSSYDFTYVERRREEFKERAERRRY